jgi:hypothetical protein
MTAYQPNFSGANNLLGLFIPSIIFVSASQVIPTLAPSIQQFIVSLNIVLVIGFIVVGWVKRLNRLRLPFLLGLSFTSGAVLFLLAGAEDVFFAGMGITVVIALVIFALTAIPQMDFSSRQLWLSIGALMLTLLSILFAYYAGWETWVIPTATLAILCLAGVLHTLFRERQSASALDFSGGVFLLNVGVMLNVLLLGMVNGLV